MASYNSFSTRARLDAGGQSFQYYSLPALEKAGYPGLARLPHRVSVLTNLSAPLPALRRFVDLVGDKLAVVSASLHLEYVSADAFVEKAVAHELNASFGILAVTVLLASLCIGAGSVMLWKRK